MLEQHIYTPDGRILATAIARSHRYYPEAGVSLPQKVEVTMPAAELALTIDVGNVQLNTLVDNPQLWALPTMAGYPQVNLSVLAIDRRDGRVLVSEDEIPGGANFADIQVDPQQRKVTLNLQVRAFTFTFTDQPTPPAPAAKAGDLSHLLTSTPLDKLRQQAESVINNVRALPAFRRRIPVPGVPLP